MLWEQNLFGSNEAFGSIAHVSKVRICIVGSLSPFPSEKRRSYILHKKKGWIYLCLITPEVGFMHSVDENNKYSLDWIEEAAYTCQWKLTALFAMLVIRAVFPTFISGWEGVAHSHWVHFCSLSVEPTWKSCTSVTVTAMQVEWKD